MPLELISIELTNRCAKACWFCYNHSLPEGETRWQTDDVVGFVRDCAANGVKAVSFGGGEPLEHRGLFDILRRLDGMLFRSVTTNGLLLRGDVLDRLVAAHPDKVHVSIHFPDRAGEVARVIAQVHQLAVRGLKSGVNFLVSRSNLPAARASAERVRAAGIGNDRIVYLPMRGRDTPTPAELADVAGRTPFQSMTCLTRCGPSPRFASIGWDRQVAWCSYTRTRRPLAKLTYAGLAAAMDGLGLEFCGSANDVAEPVGRRPELISIGGY
jgi:hypothetical protein